MIKQGPRYKVPLRRRREGKTDYRYRLRLLRSGLPRVVFRKSNKHVSIQFAEYDPSGDRIVSSAHSKELAKFGWNHSTGTTPSAYLTGYLAAKRALRKGIGKAVFDLGLHVPTRGGRAFAGLKGVVDAGIKVPYDEKIVPPEERISGSHLGEDVSKDFHKVKKRIEEELDGTD